MSVNRGDFIRVVMRENPTTGYWWHTNASRRQDAGIREVYNGFEAPHNGMMGASGKRILVFEINDPNALLGFGLARPWEVDESEWEGLGTDQNLNSHLFTKTIGFMEAPEDDESVNIEQ